LLAKHLQSSGLAIHADVSHGWPNDPSKVATADTIVIYGDGLEAHVANGHLPDLRRHFETGKGLAIIHFALEPGDLADVRLHLSLNPASATKGGSEKSRPPLEQAILRNKTDIAITLLESGAAANSSNSSKRTPLHLAIDRNNPAVVTALLNAGAKPNFRDNDGWPPLHHAAAKNQLETAKALLAGGISPNGLGIGADFATLDITADRTVTLDSTVTLCSMTFGDTTASHNWILNAGNGGSLALNITTGAPTINVNNQTTTINIPLSGTNGMIKSGAGTLTLAALNTYTGNLTVNHQHQEEKVAHRFGGRG
jgi:autotransporter-associated beta strand protein